MHVMLTHSLTHSLHLVSPYNQALSGFCGFMAANLYARSIFGEDALANVSIEKPIHLGPDAPVNGHIRIRAKSQVRNSLSTQTTSQNAPYSLYSAILL
jgi:hypothetical protein